MRANRSCMIGNNIENEGAAAMAPVLAYGTHLTCVDLRSNGITVHVLVSFAGIRAHVLVGQSPGFKAIFDAVAESKSITSLDLSSSSAKGNMYIGIMQFCTFGSVFNSMSVTS